MIRIQLDQIPIETVSWEIFIVCIRFYEENRCLSEIRLSRGKIDRNAGEEHRLGDDRGIEGGNRWGANKNPGQIVPNVAHVGHARQKWAEGEQLTKSVPSRN